MGKSGKDARKEVRAKASKGRDAARAGRDKVRSAARGACGLLACVLLLAVVGCASATPSSASNSQDISGCTVTITLNVPAPVVLGTNGLDSVADWAEDLPEGFSGPLVINIHDVLGTQAVNNEGQTSQTATPTNQNGLTGDKPIEEVAAVGKAALSAGTSAVAESAEKAVTSAVGSSGSQ